MTDIHPVFSADSSGVITAVGWGDPSNIESGGTISQPIDISAAQEQIGA